MKRIKKSSVSDAGSPTSKKQKPGEKLDFFNDHFIVDLDDPVAEQLSAGVNASKALLKSDLFENSSTTLNSNGIKIHCTDVTRRLPFEKFGHVFKLLNRFKEIYPDGLDKEQEDLYQVIGRYMDLCFVGETKSYMPLLSLHSLNHVVKTRNIILKNNETLEKASKTGNLTDDMIESARDQGLSRPKVLFITPMRKFAHYFIKNLIELYFPDEKRTIMNRSRFEEEFGDNGHVPHERKKPDFRELMSGNIDDCFRIGIQVSRKSIKLYQKFSEADILVCSPIGMRMVIGEEGETEGESDFLSSIEVVIVDRANIIMMQNWEHLMHLLNTVNCVPKKIETDISRVRQWSIKNFGKLYRQMIIFSEINFTELHSLFYANSKNYAGGLTVIKNPKELLNDIEKPLLQEFHRFDCQAAANQSDLRFDYFTRNILPSLEHGTLIFVSSYFDFVRLRNYMKKENESFVQLHEYAKLHKISRARDMFYHRKKKLIIMTERFHFFKRFTIKGVASIVFYQLPMNPHFFSELINESSPEGRLESKVVFSRFDIFRLQNIFGSAQAKELIKSDKKFHALVSE